MHIYTCFQNAYLRVFGFAYLYIFFFCIFMFMVFCIYDHIFGLHISACLRLSCLPRPISAISLNIFTLLRSSAFSPSCSGASKVPCQYKGSVEGAWAAASRWQAVTAGGLSGVSILVDCCCRDLVMPLLLLQLGQLVVMFIIHQNAPFLHQFRV